MTNRLQQRWPQYLTFLSIALFGCLLDLWSKWWMFETFGMPGEKPSYWFWEGVFGFTTSLNEGTLFSLGQGATPLFAALSVITCIALFLWLTVFDAAKSWLLTVCLGCVSAGALGNFYDRIGLPGLFWNYANALHDVGEPVYAVRDFIDFRLIEWPIFNLADSFIVVGTALLMFYLYITPDEKPEETTNQKEGEVSQTHEEPENALASSEK
ncbi:Lipoprotein signal peptidase [Planctomycetales bacterium 10988]|nr:Lipoprotein signal peptidase [Planctomycetales bacterium 10988]